MKVQIATLAMNERGYLQFKLHLHDELREQLEAAGEHQKDYLRDRMNRYLRERFGSVPWFFFVMEDRSKTGEFETRPHAHGSIEIRPAPLPRLKNDKPPVKYRRIAAKRGLKAAELEYGLVLTLTALKAASGNGGDRPGTFHGISQSRNLWRRKPYHPLFNPQWVDYAFKNIGRFSRTLDEGRLAFSYPLRQEAQRLWRLITEGESAICQWEELAGVQPS